MTPACTAVTVATLCLGALPTIAAPSTSGALSRCLSSTGAVLFTQFGCPPGSTATDPAAPEGLLSVVGLPALTDAERRVLAALDAELARQRQARRRDQASRARARNEARHEAQARCAESIQQLDAIAANRRKGYSAAQDRHFDEQERRWRRVRRTSC